MESPVLPTEQIMLRTRTHVLLQLDEGRNRLLHEIDSTSLLQQQCSSGMGSELARRKLEIACPIFVDLLVKN